jgi:hypothetical protein
MLGIFSQELDYNNNRIERCGSSYLLHTRLPPNRTNRRSDGLMKSKTPAAWEHVQLAAKLADLKEDHYRTVLTLSAMLELFIDKGMITREELSLKAEALDRQLESLISASVHPMP